MVVSLKLVLSFRKEIFVSIQFCVVIPFLQIKNFFIISVPVNEFFQVT